MKSYPQTPTVQEDFSNVLLKFQGFFVTIFSVHKSVRFIDEFVLTPM